VRIEKQAMHNGSIDLWEIASDISDFQAAHSNNSLFSNYLRTFKPEIIEIISQLITENKLAGYKINHLDLYQKIRHSITRIFNEFKNTKSTKDEFSKKLSNLVFIIEFENHFKQYKNIKTELNEKSINHSVVFLNRIIYEKHKGEIDHPFFLRLNYHKIDFLKSFYKLIVITWNIIFNFKLTNSYPFKREIL